MDGIVERAQREGAAPRRSLRARNVMNERYLAANVRFTTAMKARRRGRRRR